MSKTTLIWAVAVTWKTDSKTSERSRITSGSSVSHWSLLSVNPTQTTQRSLGRYSKEKYPKIIKILMFPRIMAGNLVITITAVLDSLIRRTKASITEACKAMNQRIWILIMILAVHLGIISLSEMHIESIQTINLVIKTTLLPRITTIIGIILATMLPTLAVINTKITRKT